MKDITKDPDAKLDYLFDWSEWLADGDTIASISIVSDSGITVVSSAITDSGATVTVWVSGGTEGQAHSVTCRATMASGRIDDRTFKFIIQQK